MLSRAVVPKMKTEDVNTLGSKLVLLSVMLSGWQVLAGDGGNERTGGGSVYMRDVTVSTGDTEEAERASVTPCFLSARPNSEPAFQVC